MAELKTRKNQASVQAFLDSVENDKRRDDARVVLQLMQEVTDETPIMWGTSIIGFGSYHYRYESGREGDWMLTGFSPRKQALTLYIMDGFRGHGELMDKLGKYKTGKSCLYVKKLEDIDMDVLRQLVAESVAYMRKTYG
ncbi:DUF1801 domain-containing protein [Lentisalinibacter sediminis]|uniref:DUF1801 domain-containing protein n=1 Tax=Lentisalinibacter sediminis TaxID=2992237 RepID=UPI00386A6415